MKTASESITFRCGATMKNRFIENYITSSIGVIILGIAVWQWIEGKSMEEVGLIAGYGFILLRSKDSLIGIKSKEKIIYFLRKIRSFNEKNI